MQLGRGVGEVGVNKVHYGISDPGKGSRFCFMSMGIIRVSSYESMRSRKTSHSLQNQPLLMLRLRLANLNVLGCFSIGEMCCIE